MDIAAIIRESGRPGALGVRARKAVRRALTVDRYSSFLNEPPIAADEIYLLADVHFLIENVKNCGAVCAREVAAWAAVIFAKNMQVIPQGRSEIPATANVAASCTARPLTPSRMMRMSRRPNPALLTGATGWQSRQRNKD